MKTLPWLAPLLACAWMADAAAQTLDQQYDFFLSGITRRCQNMNFAVDDELVLLPGQAGPRLQAFCSGPLPVSGGGSANSQGGGAGAAGGARGAFDDAALRRRRDHLRAEDKDAPNASARADAQGEEFGIFDSGNASAFLSLDYQHERQKVTRYEAGHTSDLINATLGVDYRFGTRAVLGLALKYDDLSGDFVGASGDFASRGRGGVLYGSWLPLPNLFIDMNAGVARRNVETRRIVGIRRVVIASPSSPPLISFSPPLQQVASDADSHERTVELRSGYDFSSGRLTFGPRVGAMFKRTGLDGFIEAGDTPMTLVFREQTDKSLTSALGLQASAAINTASGVLLPQLNLDWLHEFQDDQRLITARFAEDLRPVPSQLRFLNAAPDRDTFRARLSAVAVFAHGFSAFVAIEGLAGHEYLDRYGASIGVRIEL